MALNYLPFLNKPVTKPTGHEPFSTFTEKYASLAQNYDGLPTIADTRPVFAGADRGPRALLTKPVGHPPAAASALPLPFTTVVYNANALHVADLESMGAAEGARRRMVAETAAAKAYVPVPKLGMGLLYNSEIAAQEARIQEKRAALERDGNPPELIEASLYGDHQQLRALMIRQEEAESGITPTSVRVERMLEFSRDAPKRAASMASSPSLSSYASSRIATLATATSLSGSSTQIGGQITPASIVSALGTTTTGAPGAVGVKSTPAVPPPAPGVVAGASSSYTGLTTTSGASPAFSKAGSPPVFDEVVRALRFIDAMPSPASPMSAAAGGGAAGAGASPLTDIGSPTLSGIGVGDSPASSTSTGSSGGSSQFSDFLRETAAEPVQSEAEAEFIAKADVKTLTPPKLAALMTGKKIIDAFDERSLGSAKYVNAEGGAVQTAEVSSIKDVERVINAFQTASKMVGIGASRMTLENAKGIFKMMARRLIAYHQGVYEVLNAAEEVGSARTRDRAVALAAQYTTVINKLNEQYDAYQALARVRGA